MHIKSWSDLEYVFAVARNGSLKKAAEALGVTHSTVLRRIDSFEHQLGFRIFDRKRTGYTLTDDARMFFEAADSIDKAVSTLNRKMASIEDSTGGSLAITTTDTLFSILPEDILAYRETYPDVQLSISVTNMVASFENRDADIAIRPSKAPPDHLVGRKICDIRFAVYATPEILARDQRISLSEREWLSFDLESSTTPVSKWLNETVNPEKIQIISDNFLSQAQLAEQGLGHVVLPRFVGDYSKKLRRLGPNLEKVSTSLWVLSHRDLLRSRHVKQGADYFYKKLKAKKEIFEGA